MKESNMLDLDGIFEEFSSSFKTSEKGKEGRYVEIFVNPTKQEIKETATSIIYGLVSVRYIATPDKKIYIFPGDVLHVTVANKLGINYTQSSNLMGVVEFKNNNFEVPSKFISYQLDEVVTDNFVAVKILKTDWKWIDKYFPGFNSWWKGFKKKHSEMPE